MSTTGPHGERHASSKWTARSFGSEGRSKRGLAQLASSLSGSFGPRTGPIAIEFRDGLVRIVQTTCDRRNEVLASACVAYDRAAPERAAEQISRAIAGGGFRGRSCVIGLPFSAVRAEVVTVPDGDDDLIRSEIARSAPLRFGFDRAQVDFVRLSDGPGTAHVAGAPVDIAAILASATAVEAICHPLIDEGLLPDAVEPSFVSAGRACSRMFRRASDQERARIAVDLHDDGATACLMLGDSIAYCRMTDGQCTVADVVAMCQRDGARFANHAQATEIRLVGKSAYDTALSNELENRCAIPVRLDDEMATLGRAYERIGVHADGPSGSGGAAAWGGVIGLAFRPPSRMTAHGSAHAPRREAA
ncbi:MAG: hypothetical protein SGJ11_06700 [Phycisphaerae bacterium]|nr:hypothetical protein [Phycisphaerae bacterium]